MISQIPPPPSAPSYPQQSPPRYRGRPSPNAGPAFRAPNPYYKTTPPSSLPEEGGPAEYDDQTEYGHGEEEGGYKHFNFYDELEQVQMFFLKKVTLICRILGMFYRTTVP